MYLPHHEWDNHAKVLGNDFQSPPTRIHRRKITFKYQENEWKIEHLVKLRSYQAVRRK